MAALMFVILAAVVPAGTTAEQASEPGLAAAGQLDSGGAHTCSVDAGAVRCWGLGSSGQLGYGTADSIGDNEAAGAAGRVNLGTGRTATAISAGEFHTCALLDNGSVRCWGFNGDGRLGLGHEVDIGDTEAPGSVAAVNLGAGRTATAITAGGAHSCAILDTGAVLCWGYGTDGRLGYGDTATIGDDEEPGTLAPVDIGAGRIAVAISAGDEHTCALLDNQTVRCWGYQGGLFGGDGRLGYGNAAVIGDDETPGSVGPVSLGAGAVAISAGDVHTCAVLVGGAVRCWGNGIDGRNGYANEFRIGDNELPSSVGPVALGASATAITAGNHTCARLTGGSVRCWGPGANGRLGYGNTNDIGDNETPASVAPVVLGGDARAISAGTLHTCARLADATLRCWGEAQYGRLGFGDENDIGDDEAPETTGPVPLRPSVSVADAVVREGDSGTTTALVTVQLSFAPEGTASVSFGTADETATSGADYTAAIGTVTFAPGDTSETIPVQVHGDTADEIDERFVVRLSSPVNVALGRSEGTVTIIDDDTAAGAAGVTPPPPPPPVPDALADALRREEQRAADLRRCRASATSRMRTERTQARRRYRSRPAQLARALRQISARAARRQRDCLRRFGRTPGRVTGLVARRTAATVVVLKFDATGSDGTKLPPARAYLVKQATRPIRTARDFDRAKALCRGSCKVDVARIGQDIDLRVTGLRRRTTYYYAVAARDNVSGRLGPRSRTVSVTTAR